MPGENSKFDGSKLGSCERLTTTNVHVGVIVSIQAVIVWGMTRYYYMWPDKRFSMHCFLLTAFLIFADAMILKGILMTKYSDPGYLFDREDEDGDSDSTREDSTRFA